jgi:hypothetical protein
MYINIKNTVYSVLKEISSKFPSTTALPEFRPLPLPFVEAPLFQWRKAMGAGTHMTDKMATP